jgi:hypothetical protein
MRTEVPTILASVNTGTPAANASDANVGLGHVEDRRALGQHRLGHVARVQIAVFGLSLREKSHGRDGRATLDPSNSVTPYGATFQSGPTTARPLTAVPLPGRM